MNGSIVKTGCEKFPTEAAHPYFFVSKILCIWEDNNVLKTFTLLTYFSREPSKVSGK